MAGRYKVEHVTLRTRDAYFESDIQYEWRVIDTTTGEVIMTFWEDYYANSEGTDESGVNKVDIDEANGRVIATYHDGKVETHPLPES